MKHVQLSCFSESGVEAPAGQHQLPAAAVLGGRRRRPEQRDRVDVGLGPLSLTLLPRSIVQPLLQDRPPHCAQVRSNQC